LAKPREGDQGAEKREVGRPGTEGTSHAPTRKKGVAQRMKDGRRNLGRFHAARKAKRGGENLQLGAKALFWGLPSLLRA